MRNREFQFSFGGNLSENKQNDELMFNGTCGFLIPHSGRIKKIKVKMFHRLGADGVFKFLRSIKKEIDKIIHQAIFTFFFISESKTENHFRRFLTYEIVTFDKDVYKYAYVIPPEMKEKFDRCDELTLKEKKLDEYDDKIKNLNTKRLEKVIKGITFLDEWEDKLILIDEGIGITFFEPVIFLFDDTTFSEFNPIHPEDILNIPVKKDDIISRGSYDITFQITFLIELDPLE